VARPYLVVVHPGFRDEPQRLKYVVVPEDFNLQRGSDSTLSKAIKQLLHGAGASLVFYDACYGRKPGPDTPPWDKPATRRDFETVVNLATTWIKQPAGTVLVVWPGRLDQVAACAQVMEDAGMCPMRFSHNKGAVFGAKGTHLNHTDEVILVGHTEDENGSRAYFWERFEPEYRDTNVLYCPPVAKKVRARSLYCH